MSEAEQSAKDLRGNWERLRERILESQGLCVLSDFDGTLVPIESRPDLPRLDEPGRALLENLRDTPRVVLGIVSGRALSDLVPRVGLSGIWYVGNHGFEVQEPQGRVHRFYDAADASYLAGVRDELAKDLQRIPGAILEYKGPVLAVHYRELGEGASGEVERIFLRVLDRHRERVMMARGHAVLEARIRSGRNKGLAVRHVRYLLPLGTLPLYFGDDQTDRDAFRELQRIGVSVEVGSGDSSLADYTLPDPRAVLDCLRRITGELRSRWTEDSSRL